MNSIIVISHFSKPNWPLVNKLAGIVRCLGVEMVHCATIDKLRSTVEMYQHRRALFFTDEGLLDYVREVERSIKPKEFEVAMFIHSTISKVAEQISQSGLVRYLLGIDSIDSSGRDLSILIKKFADRNILDLEKYLAFGCSINERSIVSPSTKREAVEAVHQYIRQLGDPSYDHPFDEYATRVTEMVDELLLNAVFDANPRMQGVDRSKPYQLKEEEKIHLAWGYDGEYFGVSVRDPFGQFSYETIMQYVASQRKRDAIAASHSAGLGLKIIFDKAHKVIANVSRGKVTEVIVLLRFETRMLEFERRKKSFYYFHTDPMAQGGKRSG